VNRPADLGWLQERCALRRPDLLAIGPVYKMAGGNPNEGPTAKAVQDALDRLRTTFDLAILLEMHTGHGVSSGARPTRPVGASEWLRWFEFGLHLSETGTLTHWRGARDERDWPAALKRGGEWPWTVDGRVTEQAWSRIVDHVVATRRVSSLRDLEKTPGISKSAIQRAIAAHRVDWQDLQDVFGGDPS